MSCLDFLKYLHLSLAAVCCPVSWQPPPATMLGYSWAGLADTLYGGVNFALPGNGGQECYDFLPPVTRLIETVVAVGISLLYFVWGYSQVTVPRTSTYIRWVAQL